MAKEYVYVIARSPCGPVKIGISQNPKARRRELQGGSPYRLFIVKCWEAPNRKSARDIEQYVLRFWPEKRLAGEWIDIDGFSATVAIDNVFWAMFAPLPKVAA